MIEKQPLFSQKSFGFGEYLWRVVRQWDEKRKYQLSWDNCYVLWRIREPLSFTFFYSSLLPYPLHLLTVLIHVYLLSSPSQIFSSLFFSSPLFSFLFFILTASIHLFFYLLISPLPSSSFLWSWYELIYFTYILCRKSYSYESEVRVAVFSLCL